MNIKALKKQIEIEKKRLSGYGRKRDRGVSYNLQVGIIEYLEDILEHKADLKQLDEIYNHAMDIFLDEFNESDLDESFRDFPERAYAMVRRLQDVYDDDATWYGKEITIVRWIKKNAKGDLFLISDIVRDTNLNYDQVRDNVKALFDRGMLIKGPRVREGQMYITSETFKGGMRK